jgi:hypothetical protein
MAHFTKLKQMQQSQIHPANSLEKGGVILQQSKDFAGFHKTEG